MDIIDQLGGVRAVSFRLQMTIGTETTDDFGLSIEVTRTSNFDWVAPSDGNFQPGLNDYDFTITNNGNSEDTFTVTAASDNGGSLQVVKVKQLPSVKIKLKHLQSQWMLVMWQQELLITGQLQ